MKRLLMGLAACTLIMTSCSKQEIMENVDANKGQLSFSPLTGKQTKASEITNSTLIGATGATKANAINMFAYYEKDGTTWTKWFDDALYYDAKEWKIGSTRFQNSQATKYFTYWPAKGVTVDKSSFEGPDFTTSFPKFTYTVEALQAGQLDLIGGVTDVVANDTEVEIQTRHLLSQVNFGVRAYEGAKITIKDIKIESVYNKADFTYKANDAAPLGTWSNFNTTTTEYNYSFGTTSGFTTEAKTIATGDTYIFGDGGKWGPGKGASTYYVLADGSAKQGTAVADGDKLSNSLMLIPQEFNDNKAKVTFKYSITDVDNAPVVDETEGSFFLNFDNAVNTAYANEWKQNYRYVYIIDFEDMLDDNKLTFTVDVETHEWENYDNNNPDDPGTGIVDIQAIGSTAKPIIDKLGDKGVFYFAKNSATQGDANLNVQVINDVTWNWTGYTFKGIQAINESITLDFTEVVFNGHTITLNLPTDGFKYAVTEGATVTGNTITIKAKGATVTIANSAYYRAAATLQTAIVGAAKDQRFVYGGTDAIDLTKMIPTATLQGGETITVKFNSSIVPTVDGDWKWDGATRTATYTAPAVP